MIGVLISMAGSAMLISGSFNLNKFYDAGEVYDVFKSRLQLNGYGMVYNYQEKCFEIQEEIATKGIQMEQIHEGEWNYIYIKISLQNSQSINVKIKYVNNEGEIVGEKQQELISGQNIIVSENISYSGIVMEFQAQSGKKIALEKVQFREQKNVFEWKKAVMLFGILQMMYYGILKVGKYIWNRKKEFVIYPYMIL